MSSKKMASQCSWQETVLELSTAAGHLYILIQKWWAHKE